VAQEVARVLFIAMMDYATWTVDRLYKELVCEVHEGKLISSRGCFMFSVDGYYWEALRSFCTYGA
jgi:hypothetical protein